MPISFGNKLEGGGILPKSIDSGETGGVEFEHPAEKLQRHQEKPTLKLPEKPKAAGTKEPKPNARGSR